MSTSALPLIDITGLRGHDPVAQHLVAEQLRKACVQHGFFYITGHGIDPELIASESNAALMVLTPLALSHIPSSCAS